MTNTMPKTGRIVLTPMLNEFGKLIGDFTIAKAGEDRFMIWGSSAAQVYHMRWFERHLPEDRSVHIHRFDQTLVGLTIAGPNARKVLEKLTDDDVSKEAFRFMDFREMAIGSAPCMVNRISYTGDLGYEIWMQPAYERLVYAAIKQAGAEFGIRDFGMRALLSMRLEKNFPTWGHELRPIYGPYEGAMDRFVKLTKNDFIGRAEAAKEKEEGPKRRRVSFVIDAGTADVMHDEPVWAKVGDTDYGTVRRAARGRAEALRREQQGVRASGHEADRRRRLARRRLGHLGRLCARRRVLDGAGLRARRARRQCRGRAVRDRDPRRALPGADRGRAAVRSGRGTDAGVRAARLKREPGQCPAPRISCWRHAVSRSGTRSALSRSGNIRS